MTYMNKKIGTSLLRAFVLNSNGNALAAVKLIRPLYEEFDHNPMFVRTLADSYFRLGRVNDAYDVLAPLTRRGADPDLLLRASLAAALRGESYEGQREFCIDSFTRLINWVDPAQLMPSATGQQELVALSFLGLGATSVTYAQDSNAEFYLTRELALDPGNPFACYLLGETLMGVKRYREAAEMFKTGEARAKGALLEALKQDLRSAESFSRPRMAPIKRTGT
jgi:predicted Zn-dependent protease